MPADEPAVDTTPVDTTPLDITPVDLADQRDLEGYFEVGAAARAVDIPDFPALTLREVIGSLRHPFRAGEPHHFLARLDGRPAGLLDVGFPLSDNTHVGHVELVVHPDLRRRGVGRRLFETAVSLIRERGRKVVIGDYVASLPGGPERDPGHAAFAAAMGATPALPEIRRRLDLDTVDSAAWSAMLADAEQRAAGYTVRSWVGDVPDDLVDEVARLEGRMNVDAPIGDLKLEQEHYDAQRIRDNEDVLRLRGRRHYHVAVRHDATGTVAAWTMLAFAPDDNTNAWQQTTIVDPDHRGHRLGTLVKIENVRFTRSHEPALRFIDTWNAAANAPMIAINEALGFHPVDRWIGCQADV
jgi:GNAT superfamily N-acetyltransferase